MMKSTRVLSDASVSSKTWLNVSSLTPSRSCIAIPGRFRTGDESMNSGITMPLMYRAMCWSGDIAVLDEVSCSGLGGPANAFAKLSRIGPCRGRVGELNVKSGMDFALRTCHAGGGNGRNIALFNDGNWLGAENRPPCCDKPS